MSVSWKHLQSLNCTVLTGPIARSPAVIAAYTIRRNEPNFKKNLIAATEKGICEHGDYWLRDNDFPYYIESNIMHKVFWFNTNCPISMNRCRDLVAMDLDITKDRVVVCCNDLPLKTVPEVEHYHVFVLAV